MQIFDDLSSLSKAAAELFIGTAAESISGRGRFLAALSGGGTPLSLYRLLVRAPLEWEKIHLFWGDERCVPTEHPENNYGQANRVLLQQISIPVSNIHRIQSELPPDRAALDYERLLQEFAEAPLEWPRFDLVILGLGEDGHVASIFPGSPVEVTRPVVAVTADYLDRPANRVTLTPLIFNTAHHILFLVSGESKSVALANVLKGNNQPDSLPAQRIRPAEAKVTWMVDTPAASRL